MKFMVDEAVFSNRDVILFKFAYLVLTKDPLERFPQRALFP